MASRADSFIGRDGLPAAPEPDLGEWFTRALIARGRPAPPPPETAEPDDWLARAIAARSKPPAVAGMSTLVQQQPPIAGQVYEPRPMPGLFERDNEDERLRNFFFRGIV